MKYDITLGFEISGSNSFGDIETLQASNTFTVESDTKENAIEIAKSKSNKEITSISVCERG
jgi:hypothetical protein